ncbi:MAG TPA: hemolysin activation/secretion protein [Cyanobacteria bacterium UBA11049]|nr:hemolysin activation/secretion protein [Cyanobacteria bacterium UBA11049]
MANNDCFVMGLLKFRIRVSLISIILLFINSITIDSLIAQPVKSAPGQTPIPLPQDIIPPIQSSPAQIPKPKPLPPPEQLLPPDESNPFTPAPITENVPRNVAVKRFEVIGSTVFSPKQLDLVLAPFTKRTLSLAELFQARSAITQLYIDNGYITSGAFISPQTVKNGVVKIQVVEGSLEAINVTGTRRLNPNYVRSRLPNLKPLNQKRLLEAIQLLKLNPLIENIKGELSIGARFDTSVLNIRVEEAKTFSAQLLADNGRAPSVGSFRRSIQLNEANLLGLGDGLRVAYTNTNGSNGIDASYSLPLNSRNGTLSFNYGFSNSDVIEEPFNVLDIIGNSHYYELTLRQPILLTPNRELALGLTADRIESNISSNVLEDAGYPLSFLSPGADIYGRTRISALRFFQEWTNRSSRDVFAARSQFSLGIGAFDATINGDDEPDSRFLSWLGQMQWVRQIAPDTVLLLKSNFQLADRALVPTEQFGVGGIQSVRGYRQDAILADNALFASAEIRLPIYRAREQQLVLQLTPFFDFGTTWDSGAKNFTDRNLSNSDTLASIGLGLRFQLGDHLNARFDWGIPLVDIDSRERTWQEKGLYFSINYNPF